MASQVQAAVQTALQHIRPYLTGNPPPPIARAPPPVQITLHPSTWPSTVTHGLALFGVLSLLSLAGSLLSTLWLFARPSRLPRSLHPSGQPYLTYALITGASDGIGRALAFELSTRGFALVLHGRNEKKLAAMADEIHGEHAALGAPRPKVLVAQADRCGQLDFAALIAPLRRLRLTVLINNVGAQGHLSEDPFHTLQDYSRDDVDRLVDLNAVFMIQLTRALMPLLLRSTDRDLEDSDFDYAVPVDTPRRRGARAPRAVILNASSAAAMGVPYVGPYAASKGFVESVSRAMRNEMRAERLSSRIEVLGMRIGNVVTNTNLGRPRLFMPAAEPYAVSMLNRVGCGESVVEPYLPHFAQVRFFSKLAGQSFLDWGIVINMRGAIKDRQRMKDEKRAREAAEGKDQ